MCQKTVLRFILSLRETFSNLITFTVINEYGKSGVIQISALFDPIYILPVELSSEERLFKRLSNNVFWNSQFRKDISYEGHLFFESVQHSSTFQKCRKKLRESLSRFR